MFFSGGKDGETGHSFDDYYFRDSFEHSSSESQLVEVAGPTLKQTHVGTPVAHTPGKLLPPLQAPVSASPQTGITSGRRFNLLQVFVPSFLLVAISLAVATVLVLESDCEVLGSFRRWPEMIVLRRDYYEPTKEFFRQRLARLLS